MADEKPNLNLQLWDRLRPVDRKFTKKITGKAYSGDSPNPQWMIQQATSALGPIGQDWGFTVQEERIVEGKPQLVVTSQIDSWGPPAEAGGQPVLLERKTERGLVRELYHYTRIRFWQKSPDGRLKGEYDAMGGTPMLILTKAGTWVMDEDASKKSLTDALTKGLSWLGVAADLFLGIFDDKYQAPITGSAEPAADRSPAQDQSALAGAPDPSQEERPSAPPPQDKTATGRKTSTPSGW